MDNNLTNESKKKRRINYLYVQLQTTRSKNKEDNDIFRRNWKSEVWIDLDGQNHITSLKYVEDNKGVIKIRISKKNRQHSGQKKKYKRTNNDLQNIHIKLKIE